MPELLSRRQSSEGISEPLRITTPNSAGQRRSTLPQADCKQKNCESADRIQSEGDARPGQQQRPERPQGMGLVQAGFEQRQDFFYMSQSMPVVAHDLAAVVQPGDCKLEGRSHHSASDNLPLPGEYKDDCRGQSQLRFEDQRTNG